MKLPLRCRFMFTLAARKVYDRSICGRSNNGDVCIDECKWIKVIGAFAHMFLPTPIEIVAALGIVRRLGKHACERKSDGRKAVGNLSF